MKCAMVTLGVSQLSQTINVLYPQEVVGTNRGHRTPVLFQQILLDNSSIDDSDWFSAGMNELAAGSPSYGRAEKERKICLLQTRKQRNAQQHTSIRKGDP